MGNVSDSWSALGNDLIVPLTLAAALALLILLLRVATSLRFLIEHRGLRPLVIQVEYGKSIEGGEDYGVLDARLLSYLAADGLGGYLIAPGAGGSAGPAVPAEALEPTTAVIRLAFPREPAFRVDVTWPESAVRDGAELRATVRISRTPGDRIVATRSFAEEATEALVEAIGAFCVTFLHSQPRILRYTPRWERWSQDISGYLAYRRGLELERRGTEVNRSLEECRQALEYFHRAAAIVPANMLVQLHRASLLELLSENQDAAEIYRKSHTLWPEHIEVAYRLWIAHKSSNLQAELDAMYHPLGAIRRQLSVPRLLRSWLLTWRPNHWNPGERRYWRSWMRLRPWGPINKRRAYLRALAIAELSFQLSSLIPGRSAPPPGNPVRLPRCDGQDRVADLFSRLSGELLRADGRAGRRASRQTSRQTSRRTSRRTDAVRLLRPGPEAATALAADPAFIPVYAGRHYRRRAVGWLAMFNAACFFSLAISLPEEYIPGDFPVAEWGDCCARASIHELGLIQRDPLNQLDPNWMAADLDLQPMRETGIGRKWQNFIGLPPPEPAA